MRTEKNVDAHRAASNYLHADDAVSESPNHTQDMTKQDEVKILRDAAEKLGSASYCGPWLRGILPGIERDIASDNPPGVQTPAEYAEAIIQEAKSGAERILMEAKREADRMLREAGNQLAEAKQSRDSANQAIVAAHRTLGDLIRSL